MANIDLDKLRTVVRELLEKDKSLTEKEVKAKAARALKVKPDDFSGGLVRDVRKSLGVDRPTALAYARELLRKDPALEARTVVETVAERFGIRIGPPDVSRLRPTAGAGRSRAGRKPGPRPAAAAGTASLVRKVRLGKGEVAFALEVKGRPEDVRTFLAELTAAVGKGTRSGG